MSFLTSWWFWMFLISLILFILFVIVYEFGGGEIAVIVLGILSLFFFLLSAIFYLLSQRGPSEAAVIAEKYSKERDIKYEREGQTISQMKPRQEEPYFYSARSKEESIRGSEDPMEIANLEKRLSSATLVTTKKGSESGPSGSLFTTAQSQTNPEWVFATPENGQPEGGGSRAGGGSAVPSGRKIAPMSTEKFDFSSSGNTPEVFFTNPPKLAGTENLPYSEGRTTVPYPLIKEPNTPKLVKK